MKAEATHAEAEPIAQPPAPSREAIRAILRERILRHFLPGRRSVLGVPLQPFTLWHWRALDAIGCPYTPDGAWELSIPQLCAAIHVLSLASNSSQPLSPTGLRAWVWAWKVRVLAWLGPAAADLYAGEELAQLHSHVIHHYEGPAKWTAEGSVGIQAPGWLYLFGQLIALGYTEDRAWSCTPGYARAIIAAVDVAKGGPDFLGEDEVCDAIEAGHSLEAFGL